MWRGNFVSPHVRLPFIIHNLQTFSSATACVIVDRTVYHPHLTRHSVASLARERARLRNGQGGMPGAASDGALQVLKHVLIQCVLYAGTRAFTVLGTLSRGWRVIQRLGYEDTRYRIRWAFLLRSNMPNVPRARSRSRSREKKPAKNKAAKNEHNAPHDEAKDEAKQAEDEEVLRKMKFRELKEVVTP